jgi:hypothetical protein
MTAIEETRKLPQTILMYPMTLASQAAHVVMRIQQNIAELLIKGDEALENIFPSKEEQPEWATFDEDVNDELPAQPANDGERLTEGRFALYTNVDPEATTTDPKPSVKEAKTAEADPPDIVAHLDYETLTLAQLRARLQSLRVGDLEALLGYESATRARAPFQTLLANRITRATAK